MILEPQIECMDQQKLIESIVRPKLSSLLLRAYQHFPFYKKRMDEAGIDPCSDPLDVLKRMPYLTKKEYCHLERDALLHANRRLYYVEVTSGTTGKPKRRFQSRNDELNELKLASRVMAGFGLSRDDVVVFIDVGDPGIYLWFSKACEAVGVKDTIYYGIQSDFGESLKGLIKLDPTVIFTVPSLLARSYDAILHMYQEAGETNLQKIVYFGEKLDEGFRKRIQYELNVEIFSHYGGTEVSTLGGECPAHNGIHIYTDVNLPMLIQPENISNTVQQGEVTWTTMQIDIQPVIKYRLGDMVQIDSSKCKCGRTSPRIKVLGRTDDGFSLYGEKFYYSTFLNTIYSETNETGFLQIILSNQKAQELMTVILPEKMKSKHIDIKDALYHMNELEFYLEEGFLDLKIEFVDNSYFTGRKIASIVDRRKY
ncbi:AMP-binding protein [Candidatus Poribacteria bacterium]|nr:AMP-binding protein [Candidatus Poribacteria bacterium]